MDYPYILLHAVCRDVSSFPHPCLYAQLDEELAEDAHEEMQATLRQQMPTEDDEEEKNDGEEDDEEESPSPSTISDLRFVPENPDIRETHTNTMERAILPRASIAFSSLAHLFLSLFPVPSSFSRLSLERDECMCGAEPG